MKKIILIVLLLMILVYGLLYVAPIEGFLMSRVSCQPHLSENPSGAILYFSFDNQRNKQLTEVSKARLELVSEIYNEGQVVYVNGHGDAKVSTVPMAIEYLVNKGVPREQIESEVQSRNTWENLSMALPKIKQAGIHQLTFVSSPYHLDRILRYYLKQNAEKAYNFKVYWSGFDHIIDNIRPFSKRTQLLVEYYATYRDAMLYDNPMSSGMCEPVL